MLSRMICSSGACVLAARMSGRFESRANRRLISSVLLVNSLDNSASNLRLPALKSLSFAMPRAFSRSASVSDCITAMLSDESTRRRKNLISLYLRNDCREMRPFTSATGMRRALHSRRKLGQSSVSMISTTAGFTAFSARRTVQRQSNGK